MINQTISLGSDTGGMDAGLIVSPHTISLRQALAKNCDAIYVPGDVFKKFALVLRVDGSVQAWHKRGIENIRFQRKSGWATADIFIHVDDWAGQEVAHIRQVLANGVIEAIEQICIHLQKRKFDVKTDILRADVQNAINQFLGSSG